MGFDVIGVSIHPFIYITVMVYTGISQQPCQKRLYNSDWNMFECRESSGKIRLRSKSVAIKVVSKLTRRIRPCLMSLLSLSAVITCVSVSAPWPSCSRRPTFGGTNSLLMIWDKSPLLPVTISSWAALSAERHGRPSCSGIKTAAKSCPQTHKHLAKFSELFLWLFPPGSHCAMLTHTHTHTHTQTHRLTSDNTASQHCCC